MYPRRWSYEVTPRGAFGGSVEDVAENAAEDGATDEAAHHVAHTATLVPTATAPRVLLLRA